MCSAKFLHACKKAPPFQNLIPYCPRRHTVLSWQVPDNLVSQALACLHHHHHQSSESELVRSQTVQAQRQAGRSKVVSMMMLILVGADAAVVSFMSTVSPRDVQQVLVDMVGLKVGSEVDLPDLLGGGCFT